MSHKKRVDFELLLCHFRFMKACIEKIWKNYLQLIHYLVSLEFILFSGCPKVTLQVYHF